MKVRNIMIPPETLTVIDAHGTIGDALKTIESKNLLSLPVDGQKLVGMLSKRFIYERFFKDFSDQREEFLAKPVMEYGTLDIPTVTPEDSIDVATAHFIGSNVPFLPVVDEHGHLCSLVTYQSIFKEYQKIYGLGHHSLLIHCVDYRGSLAHILDIIAKAGGSIKNIVLRVSTRSISSWSVTIWTKSSPSWKRPASTSARPSDLSNQNRREGPFAPGFLLPVTEPGG